MADDTRPSGLDDHSARLLAELSEAIHGDARAVRERLLARLGELRADRHADPFLNPLKLLASELFFDLDAGRLTIDAVRDVIQLISAEALLDRARRAVAYLGAESRPATAGGPLARDDDGDFEGFRSRVERPLGGIVFTAHPTFGTGAAIRQAAMEVASGEDAAGNPLDEDALRGRIRFILEQTHAPEPDIDLDLEYDQAGNAIRRLADAIDDCVRATLRHAREPYPERWRELTPRPLTVASWVGFDLDGRTDIGWTAMFRKRLMVSAVQMRRYLTRAEGLLAVGNLDGGAATAVGGLAERLREGLAITERQIDAFDCQSGDIDAVRVAAKLLADSRERQLADPAELIGLLQPAIDTLPADADVLLDLLAFRAEIAGFGLAAAQPHVRLNATQIYNAFRHANRIEADLDDPAQRRVLLRRVSELLPEVETETFNLGSITAERTTARRLFMVIKLFRRYCDNAAPIRFLIAETESPFILLGALYFAKQFGVDQMIDISPLFETPEAMENGSEVMRQALEDPTYRAYVEARGRIAVQTGFSDAGRFVGQPAASLAVERFQIKLAKTLHEFGLEGLELVIFDTHGESIGRGAHPRSLADRFDYVLSPMARHAILSRGLTLVHETSFQGGDGFALFATPTTAAAVVRGFLEHVHGPVDPTRAKDPFYAQTDQSLDFFIALTHYNRELMDDTNYGRLVLTFADKMTYKSGSRHTKRQHERKAGQDAGQLRQIRAIPHNTTLQQLGWMANSLAGFGSAYAHNRDWFRDVQQDSNRLRRLLTLVARAHDLSNVDTLAVYVALYDPGHWLDLATASGTGQTRRGLCRLAQVLETENRHEAMRRVLRRFEREEIDLREALADAGIALAGNDEMTHGELPLLHGLRAALLMYAFRLAMRLPRFGDPTLSIEDVVDEILALEITDAVDKMATIFPRMFEPVDVDAFGDKASYRAEGGRDYTQEHEELFQPLIRIHDVVRQVSTAVGHIAGATG